ncbi:hypothetical protein EDC19_0635 [Natranaerovirga hydrolytica]|uniref:Uncharacterized protein n=1 Tax=Natranaerovirga hydrolytica TaxID=680378 RepID=A0A4R1MYC6_9FIRM|nr:hypothetical protein [Natranaerovirga hydrolytica]TCK98216.1 hypothetical protein EDC19_0635 [Natranaerovirga hydrolytica]
MEKFDLIKHNKKMFNFTKNAAKGTYPSKKVAKIGSIIGTIIGAVLVLIGVVSSLLGSSWGVGSMIAGIISIISNILNLNRIK